MSKILITGGAGFIGCNVAAHHLRRGDTVWVFDNLSRVGAQHNLDWLRSMDCAELTFVKGDVRDMDALVAALGCAPDRLYHLAGQVAVTSSVTDPRTDFEQNALGTFNVLEATRLHAPETIFLYASTNKVYGDMVATQVVERETRYAYRDLPQGIAEDQPLDFHSPYGCSKGCGDQYVRDYARIYGLRTVVMRQSCIYGPRQFGVEDQGWVAHFCIAARQGRPITIYGDGKQVRDVLWMEDLMAAYDAAVERIDTVAGDVFNIGGGPDHTVSIGREFRPMLEALAGHPLEFHSGPWRPGDQRIYCSDIRKAQRDLDWHPQTDFASGLRQLWEWIGEQFGPPACG